MDIKIPAPKRLIINIDPVIHKKIKMAALKRGMTIRQWLEAIIIPAILQEEQYD